MSSEISLFSQKDFIQASKQFVCVRLGTYEKKEHQDMVRSLLRGTFQNTACVVYAPDGETKLTPAGRGPHHAFGSNDDAITGMAKIATKYPLKEKDGLTVLQDFHSFKQSLNVSSTDQRLLVFSVPDENEASKTSETLRKVFNDPEISGRFHFDTAGEDDTEWATKVTKESKTKGIFIIHSDTFGQSGSVITELASDASSEEIKTALLKANKEFADNEKRKVYSEHVAQGKKEGINFKNTIQHGEDRDGDGKIDEKRKRAFEPK